MITDDQLHVRNIRGIEDSCVNKSQACIEVSFNIYRETSQQTDAIQYKKCSSIPLPQKFLKKEKKRECGNEHNYSVLCKGTL
jgi:hypothetical protein